MATGSDTVSRYHGVVKRLCAAFPMMTPDTVERDVLIMVDCTEHLGYSPTEELVERLVRDHLNGRVATQGHLPPAIPSRRQARI